MVLRTFSPLHTSGFSLPQFPKVVVTGYHDWNVKGRDIIILLHYISTSATGKHPSPPLNMWGSWHGANRKMQPRSEMLHRQHCRVKFWEFCSWRSEFVIMRNWETKQAVQTLWTWHWIGKIVFLLFFLLFPSF